MKRSTFLRSLVGLAALPLVPKEAFEALVPERTSMNDESARQRIIEQQIAYRGAEKLRRLERTMGKIMMQSVPANRHMDWSALKGPGPFPVRFG